MFLLYQLLLLFLLFLELFLAQLILFIPILFDIYRRVFGLLRILGPSYWALINCEWGTLVEALLLIFIKTWQLFDDILCVFIVVVLLALPCLCLVDVTFLVEGAIWILWVILRVFLIHYYFVWQGKYLRFPNGLFARVPIVKMIYRRLQQSFALSSWCLILIIVSISERRIALVNNRRSIQSLERTLALYLSHSYERTHFLVPHFVAHTTL